jgi:tetratricopeptide (TPR) repeat protein
MHPLETPQSLLLADCLLQVGEPGRAAALLKPLEEYSDDRALTYMLGIALLRDNRTDEAQTVLNQILGEGDSAEGSFLLGQLEYLRQNLAAAEQHLAQAVKLNPKLPGAHSLYGQVLRSLSKLDEATEQFRAELEVNPYDFTANVEAAMLRKQEGEYEEALAHIARALQARPTDPGVRLQRASIRLQQGLFDEARHDVETLLQEYPDFSEAHATLAMVYYRLGRKADGDRAREAAMRTQQAAENQLEDARRKQKP